MKKLAILLLSLFLLSCSKEIDNKFCWECRKYNSTVNITTTVCDKTEVEISEWERKEELRSWDSVHSGLMSAPLQVRCSKK